MPVRITTVTSPAEADEALDLAERVWGARPISTPLLRALEFAGLYLAVARDESDDTLVGMCAGFVGMRDDGPRLHSHLAAVVDARRGSGVGRDLKRHQRSWCLDHGIATVTWTFDPLVGPNARFNLHHLGAVGDRYLVNLYGAMDDAINRGDDSDRLLVRWDLDGARTIDCLTAPLPTPDGDALRDDGAVDVVVASNPQAPVVVDTDAAVRLVATPADILRLRAHDPAAARRWRVAVRVALQSAFADGLRPTALTHDHAYVLRRPS